FDPKKTEEQPLVNIGYPTYNFDILDGLKYEIDVTQPAKYDKDGKVVNANANRIVNMTYEGKPVADNQEFIVATNNYRGSSQTFPGVSKGEVVYQSQDETRQIIVKYMQKIKDIDPAADQNWTFKPIVADKLNTTFDSSPNAQKYIKKDGKISYVGPSENQFAKYEYDKFKNGVEDAKANISNKGVTDLEWAKVSLNDLNGQLQATNNLIGDAIPVLESTNKVLADVNSGKNLNGGIAKLNKIQNSVQKGIDATNKATTLINNGQKPTKEVVESINEASQNASAQLGDF
ncbi:5'-nucleotidase C-terminal domain-containing protein, partial [Bacillus sp. SS-TM]